MRAMSEQVAQLQATHGGDDQTLNAAIRNPAHPRAGSGARQQNRPGSRRPAAIKPPGSPARAKVVTDGQQATGEALQQLTTKTDKTQIRCGHLCLEAVAEQGGAGRSTG